ncbi:hypothetical protein CP_0514 [Chlamydia pneumoniae AR39]|uniref:Uncharacterized protein n=1 Tax=Chlamydia pneumoniae TaxID=83558 RepID=Q9K257_CHLPN|nr:hypothetical protein CP_0514 [Chlamydia pneumoniae AR39]
MRSSFRRCLNAFISAAVKKKLLIVRKEIYGNIFKLRDLLFSAVFVWKKI